MLDYEMETISSANDIKYDSADEHNRHFCILQMSQMKCKKPGNSYLRGKTDTIPHNTAAWSSGAVGLRLKR